MRAVKARRLRKQAVETLADTPQKSGYQQGRATYWGYEWRRFYRHLKRAGRHGN